jgi:anti-sigma regulatory factor (Ser/Thr protein kinase)
MAIVLLPAHASSVPAARRWATAAAIRAVKSAGRPAGDIDIDSLAVAVSELTGNAVRQGTDFAVRGLRSGPRFLLQIEVSEDGIRVAVRDGAGTATGPQASNQVRPMPGPAAESGRCLALVEALTGRPAQVELIGGRWQVTAVVGWRRS